MINIPVEHSQNSIGYQKVFKTTKQEKKITVGEKSYLLFEG